VRRENNAATEFEARWTRWALFRVDPELAKRLGEQRALYTQMLLDGYENDIVMHGEAMVRGWRAAIARMDGSQGGVVEPDDAYWVGDDPKSGIRVVVGQQRASEKRARELYGGDALFLTPDEVAVMAGALRLQRVEAVKAVFPGAQIVKVQKKEGGA
jgi:hypothetical protein